MARLWTLVVALMMAIALASHAGAQTLAYPPVSAPTPATAPAKAKFGVPQTLEAVTGESIAYPAARPLPSGTKSPPPSTAILDDSRLETAIPAPEPANRRFALDAFWDNGLRFESKDDQFHLHIGGSAQIDSTWLIGPQSVFLLPNGSDNGINNAAATFLRRARLRADGNIFGLFDFVVEYDFANAVNDTNNNQPPSFSSLLGSPTPANVWMQIRDVPVLGNVRVGFQNKPIGMSNNTSHNYLPFMERPDNHDAFYAAFDGGQSLGLTASYWTEAERATWVYGVFRPSTNDFGVTLNKYALGGARYRTSLVRR